MSRVQSFPPIADAGARILILGSMPGRESLRANQYYAHPRNAFWPIMGNLTGAIPALPYEQRALKLRAAGIALWDVLASCTRPGSLDSDINQDSIHPNDFAAFFRKHPHIERVYFNGAMAEQSFRKHVLPQLGHLPLRLQRLPSTSPANASLRFEQKLEAWKTILEGERI
ncbi:MAG: DNA-deoxyinosine glycosylase [Gallionellales bacterium GWA2_60_142]|nr:MAG: DNA-deoxyinosine glycosylase [Gallionellales bacterium GWA2_60_142]HCI13242.1 DNA-deoxyinosine glycosylase [Gallionellaceae bacterium]